MSEQKFCANIKAMSIQAAVFNFLNKGEIAESDGLFYCQTRNQSAARLGGWLNLLTSLGLNSNESSILTAILGELTNNSFDHNLGHWHEPAGCIVAFEKKAQALRLYVGDRGQGIISSLKHVLHDTISPQSILNKAFEERISGRSPEMRGNGLKFIKKHLVETNNSLICISEGLSYQIGSGQMVVDTTKLPANFGTLTVIEWRLP